MPKLRLRVSDLVPNADALPPPGKHTRCPALGTHGLWRWYAYGALHDVFVADWGIFFQCLGCCLGRKGETCVGGVLRGVDFGKTLH